MTDWAAEELGFFVRIVTQQIAPAAVPDETFAYYSLPAFDATGGPVAQEGRSIKSGKFRLGQPGVLVSKLNPRKMRVQAFQSVGGRRAVASTEFMVYVPRLDVLNLRYLKHLLSSTQFARRLQAAATGTTNSHVRVKPSETLRWPVRVPPLEEQRRIAKILDTMDDTIQATERVIAKDEGVRAGLVTGLLSKSSGVGVPQDWTSDRSRNTGPLRDHQQVGMNNWVTVRLLELAESMVDGPFGSDLKTEHYVQDAGVRVVRLANLGEGRYLNEDEAFVAEDHAGHLGRHDVRSGDVLVASLGDDNHRPGRASLYPDEFAPGIVKADCFRIRPLGSVDPRFLMEILNSRSVTSQIRRLAQGVTRDRINLDQLRWVVLQMPPLEEQRRIAEIIDTVDRVAYANEKQLCKLRELRFGLAGDLLSGRVRTVAA